LQPEKRTPLDIACCLIREVIFETGVRVIGICFASALLQKAEVSFHRVVTARKGFL